MRTSEEKYYFKNESRSVCAFLYKDYSIEPHNHDFFEINIVMKGKGVHQIDKASFAVTPGDVFVIPPMVVHSYYDTENLDVYHILLQKRFVFENRKEYESIPGFLQLIETEPFLRQHFSKEMFLHLSYAQLMQLKTDLDFIDENNSFHKDGLEPLKNHTTWKILYWFSDLLRKQTYKDERKNLNKYEMEIIGVLEYIHRNYCNKITIDSLCKRSFLSRSTLLRSFYNVCKCSPIEYVNRYRCKKALELLDNTRFSKTEIAHSCGFYDLSHMERTMKRLL